MNCNSQKVQRSKFSKSNGYLTLQNICLYFKNVYVNINFVKIGATCIINEK